MPGLFMDGSIDDDTDDDEPDLVGPVGNSAEDNEGEEDGAEEREDEQGGPEAVLAGALGAVADQMAGGDQAALFAPQLAQLASLDASMADTLADFSRRAFAGVPHLLAKRFYYLNQQYRQARAEQPELTNGLSSSVRDETARWLQKDGWLDRFIREMQAVLLAELELRLMPVIGLIEALEFEVETTQ